MFPGNTRPPAPRNPDSIGAEFARQLQREIECFGFFNDCLLQGLCTRYVLYDQSESCYVLHTAFGHIKFYTTQAGTGINTIYPILRLRVQSSPAALPPAEASIRADVVTQILPPKITTFNTTETLFDKMLSETEMVAGQGRVPVLIWPKTTSGDQPPISEMFSVWKGHISAAFDQIRPPEATVAPLETGVSPFAAKATGWEVGEVGEVPVFIPTGSIINVPTSKVTIKDGFIVLTFSERLIQTVRDNKPMAFEGQRQISSALQGSLGVLPFGLGNFFNKVQRQIEGVGDAMAASPNDKFLFPAIDPTSPNPSDLPSHEELARFHMLFRSLGLFRDPLPSYAYTYFIQGLLATTNQNIQQSTFLGPQGPRAGRAQSHFVETPFGLVQTQGPPPNQQFFNQDLNEAPQFDNAFHNNDFNAAKMIGGFPFTPRQPRYKRRRRYRGRW